MPRPKRSEQVDLQEAIRAVAWKQIGEMGAAALSLRAIARELGITAPAIYNYFPSREDLITALVMEAFGSFGDALIEARDNCAPDDHAGRFRAMSTAYYRWAITYPQRYMLIFGTPLHGFELAGSAGEVAQRSFMALVSGIGEAYQAGAIHLPETYLALPPGLDAHYRELCQMGIPYEPIVIQLALAVWSRIHGMVSLELYGILPGFVGDHMDEYIDHEIEAGMKFFGLK